MEKGLIDQLIHFRKELHKHPEVSGQEYGTQKLILDFLNELGVAGKKIGRTGVYVLFDSGKPGKMVMLRSDHDALPIQESNEFAHKSSNDGISHKCGHDGHSSIMAGVVQHFKNHPLQKGKLLVIFQPAEETGEGAKAVLDDPAFVWTPDYAFALHNIPGFEKNKVLFKEGNFTAAAKSIIIRLQGKTSHAAEPEKGANPALALSDLIQMFRDLNQPDMERDDFALATPIYMKMGEKSYGVSAGTGEIHYTLRTWNRETMNPMTDKLLVGIDRIASKYNSKASVSWTEEFASNRNDAEAVAYIKKAVESLDIKAEERQRPFKWGEDFGLFTQKFKGAMFGLGAGLDSPPLHNPDYDFPDDITETGIRMFTEIVSQITHE